MVQHNQSVRVKSHHKSTVVVASFNLAYHQWCDCLQTQTLSFSLLLANTSSENALFLQLSEESVFFTQIKSVL